jgi:dihydroorotate dehydrogenase (fumarate)
VHAWEDAIKGILAGASAIQLCSVLYQKGPEIVVNMLTYMEEWMEHHNYKSLAEFKGKLNYANIASPALYERVQFMKYFSNYKQ